ncbi:MAG: hypothetical protein J6M38_00940, partial [Lentisphaeria bacterium]|nr:hypothetical protein [Lentisphaeria bacterium]
LERRDFTMNALAYHPASGVVDVVGGVRDIRENLVRCVGDPDRRFREDALRMLRALRFASVFGMDIDRATAQAIHRNRELLTEIAVERGQVELTKLLCGVGASRILGKYPEIIAHVLPHLEINGVSGAAELIQADEEMVKNGYPKNPALRYALLFSSLDEKQTADAMNSLKPSRDEKNAVMAFAKKRQGGLELNKYAVKCLMRDVNDAFPGELARYFRAAGSITEPELHCAEETAEEILKNDECRRVNQLCVGGQDMMALGLKGKQIGDTLASLLDDVMRGSLENDRETLLHSAERRNNG